MANPSLEELYTDLEVADQLGDTELARRITNRIRVRAETAPRKQAIAGVKAGLSGLARNVGIPFTDIDVAHGLEKLGASRPYEELSKEAQEAGGIAPVTRLATELAATIPAGGAVVKMLRGLAPEAGVASTMLDPGAPFKARLLRSAVEGGTAGAMTGQGQPLTDIASGSVAGALGGMIASALGLPFTGLRRISPAAAELSASGLPMTMGQAAPETMGGKVLRNLEDIATSTPFVGTALRDIRGRGQRELVARTLRRALPQGMQLPATAGSEPWLAAQDIGEEFGKRYDDILGGAVGATRAPVTPQLRGDVLRAAFSNTDDYLPRAARDHVTGVIRRKLDAPDMTLRKMFSAQSDLRAAARKIGYGPSVTQESAAMRDAYTRAANQLRGTVEDSAPELAQLSGPYRQFAIVDEALNKAKGFGETLTPAALQRIAQKLRDPELERTARAAASVLPERLPNSGTTDRAAMLATLAGLGGLGGYSQAQDPSLSSSAQGAAIGVGAGALLPALVSMIPGGSRYILGQFPIQQALANLLRRAGANIGGTAASGEE